MLEIKVSRLRSTKFLFTLALIYSSFLFLINAADANTLDFGDYRQNKFLSKFIGTYVSHDQLGRERISSVWIDKEGLHMWELGGFPVFVWHNFTFTFPLEKHDMLEETRGTGVRRIGGPSKRKKYFIYTEYGVEDEADRT